MNIEDIITTLHLKPHPLEGGFYCETYRCLGEIPPSVLADCYEGGRCFATAIYYLLTPETFSEFHRLPTDEVFHFYLGDPVQMWHLNEAAGCRQYVLGPDILDGQQVQLVVPANVWQGCRLAPGGKFALLGCTVSPGFDFKDYESGDRTRLTANYPQAQDIINNLTRESGAHD